MLKLDSDGQFQWSVIWEEQNGFYITSIVLDPDSSIYIAGRFCGTVDLDPGPGVDMRTSTNPEYYATFLIKLGPDNSYKWGCVWDTYTPVNYEGVRITDIKETPSGDIIVAGGFEGIADLDPGPGVDIHDSEAEWASFLIKLDSDGGFKWAKSWTAGYVSTPIRAPAIAIDQNENIYIAHWFGLPTDLDPGPKQDIRYSNGGSDVFMSKFDPDGNFLWAKTWGGPGSDDVTDVLIDNNNLLWIGGKFDKTVDFDPARVPMSTRRQAPTGKGHFSASSISMATILACRLGTEIGRSRDIRCDAFNNIYYGWDYGHSDGGTDFDPGPKTEIHDPEGPYDDNGNYGQRPFLLKTPADGNWW